MDRKTNISTGLCVSFFCFFGSVTAMLNQPCIRVWCVNTRVYVCVCVCLFVCVTIPLISHKQPVPYRHLTELFGLIQSKISEQSLEMIV